MSRKGIFAFTAIVLLILTLALGRYDPAKAFPVVLEAGWLGNTEQLLGDKQLAGECRDTSGKAPDIACGAQSSACLDPPSREAHGLPLTHTTFLSESCDKPAIGVNPIAVVADAGIALAAAGAITAGITKLRRTKKGAK